MKVMTTMFLIGVILFSVGIVKAEENIQEQSGWNGKIIDTINNFFHERDRFPIENTTLQITLEIKGKYAKSKDEFDAIVSVKNNGYKNAIATKVSLKGIPKDWKVDPDAESVSMGTIKPGETKKKTFDIKRGKTNSTIYAVASAQNAPQVKSNTFAVPISLFLVPVSLIIGFVIYRRWQQR